MSEKRSFYVSDPDNYIQREVIKHIEKSYQESFFLRVSYPPEKQPASRTGKITKILKPQKPKLFCNYLQRTNYMFIDLILNEARERDVALIKRAITSAKSIENNIKIVVFSSLMSWANTDRSLFPRPPKAENEEKQEDQVDEPQVTDNKDMNGDRTGQEDDAIAQPDNQIDQPLNDEAEEHEPLMPLSPNFVRLRKPHEQYLETKKLEDELMELAKVNERVEVHMLYVGMIYGQDQYFVRDYFERAWRQLPLPLPHDRSALQAKVPMIDVQFLVQSAFKIIEDDSLKPEFTDYDNYSLPLSTQALQESVHEVQPVESQLSHAEDEDNDDNDDSGDHPKQDSSDRNQSGNDDQAPNMNNDDQVDVEPDADGDREPEVPKINMLRVYFMHEPKVLTHAQILDIINKSLGSGETTEVAASEFNFPDFMCHNFELDQNQIIDKICEENAQDFSQKIKQAVKEFCEAFNLRPIKVMLNDECKFLNSIINELVAFYALPVIDAMNFMGDLTACVYFQPVFNTLLDDQKELVRQLEKFGAEKLLIDKTSNEKALGLYMRLLKFRLSLNDCKTKGFILHNLSPLHNHIDLHRIFYANEMSRTSFEAEVVRTLKQYKKQLERERIEREKQAKKEELERRLAEKKRQKEELAELKRQQKAQEKLESNPDNPEDDVEPNNDVEPKDDLIEPEDEEKDLEEDGKEEPEETTGVIEEEEEQEELQAIPKKKRESFFPEHFLVLGSEKVLNSYSKQILQFCCSRSIEYYLEILDLNDKSVNIRSKQELAFETVHGIRIYIERVS